MSHTVEIKLIANQYINLLGKEYNIHDIHSIELNEDGKVIEVHEIFDYNFNQQTEKEKGK